MLLRQCAQRAHLARRDKAVEEQRWHHREKQGDTASQQEADAHKLHSGFHKLWLVEELLQSHHSQQRYCELSDYQYRCHGTELRVHRYIVEEEVGESHEITSPRKEYRQNGGCKQSPLHWALYDEQAQDEEHHDECSNIYRTAGSRLLAPILTYLLIDALIVRIGLLHGNLTLRHRH